MLKRGKYKKKDQRSAQSMAEYLMVMGAVLAVMVAFARPGGTYMNSINSSVQQTITMMNVTATDIFNDIGTVN